MWIQGPPAPKDRSLTTSPQTERTHAQTRTRPQEEDADPTSLLDPTSSSRVDTPVASCDRLALTRLAPSCGLDCLGRHPLVTHRAESRIDPPPRPPWRQPMGVPPCLNRKFKKIQNPDRSIDRSTDPSTPSPLLPHAPQGGGPPGAGRHGHRHPDRPAPAGAGAGPGGPRAERDTEAQPGGADQGGGEPPRQAPLRHRHRGCVEFLVGRKGIGFHSFQLWGQARVPLLESSDSYLGTNNTYHLT